MGKTKITAVILTKNEEANLEDCITSVSFCDEVLVIDDYSKDTTVAIAKAAGATVLSHALDGDFAAARNVGLDCAKGRWVLFVDADERVSKELQKEILAKIEQESSTKGFEIIRFDFMKGKMLTHGETGNVRFLRLAQKNAGIWVGRVHETWEITGEVELLEAPLLHYPHQTIEEFLSEINFYTDVRAKELYKNGVHTSVFAIISYPFAKFVKNYLLKQGYKDGTEGIIMALMMSFHSFLVRGKLWQLWDQKSSQ